MTVTAALETYLISFIIGYKIIIILKTSVVIMSPLMKSLVFLGVLIVCLLLVAFVMPSEHMQTVQGMARQLSPKFDYFASNSSQSEIINKLALVEGKIDRVHNSQNDLASITQELQAMKVIIEQSKEPANRTNALETLADDVAKIKALVFNKGIDVGKAVTQKIVGIPTTPPATKPEHTIGSDDLQHKGEFLLR